MLLSTSLLIDISTNKQPNNRQLNMVHMDLPNSSRALQTISINVQHSINNFPNRIDPTVMANSMSLIPITSWTTNQQQSTKIMGSSGHGRV